MDMQQTMQQLLARMDAWGKEINANKEKADADRIADREYKKQMMKRTDEDGKRMEARMDANQVKACKQEDIRLK
jgi:hypothetical protein